MISVLNFAILQWFGVRLLKLGDQRRWIRWVLPLTGWWSDYKWIWRVYPPKVKV